MKKIVSFLVAAAACFGTAFAQTEEFVSKEAQNRKIVLEEYTGYRCPNCPDGHKRANELMEKYAGQMFSINIHTDDFGAPQPATDPDLRTDYGEPLDENAKVQGYPAGSLNRHAFSGSGHALGRSEWAGFASRILQMSSYVNIAAKGVLDWENRQLELTVQIYYTESSPSATNFLNVAVLQNNIIGIQYGAQNNPDQVTEDGKYIHNHALRDLITGQWGVEIESTKKGNFTEKKFTYKVPESIRNIPLELVDLDLVAFITESKDEIMNACHVELEHKNSPDHIVNLKKIEPQPEIDDKSCEANTKLTVLIEPRIITVPISSITFEFESSAGITEFEYKPENILQQNEIDTTPSVPVKILANGENERVSAKIVKINGKDYTFGTQATTEVVKSVGRTSASTISVHIWQDKYGSDITWELVQADNGAVVAQGGPYADQQLNGTVERTATATISAACHIFTIYDKSGDGINSNYGEGHLLITDGDNIILSNNGKYKSYWRGYITKGTVANENLLNRFDIKIVPNPANNQSVLSFELTAAQNVHVRIMASNGACALDLGDMSLSAGKQNIELPVSKLAEGLYFVQVSGKGLNLAQKLMVIR